MTAPDEVDRFVDRWLTALAASSHVPSDPDRTRAVLRRLTARLVDALGRADRHSLEDLRTAGESVGAALVDIHVSTPAALGETLTVLAGLGALTRPGGSGPLLSSVDDRLSAVQAGVATGYAHATWHRVLAEQEQTRVAAVGALTHAYESLRARETRLRAVFASAGVGMAVADARSRIVEANDALAALLARPTADLTGRALTDLLDPAELAVVAGLLRGEDEDGRFEHRVETADGGLRWLDVAVSGVRDGSQPPRHVVLVARDATQRHLLSEKLRHDATHDPLTRLPNRALFFAWLEEVFDHATRDDRVGVCYVDLDGFKAVNDTLGHDAGDELLAVVAARMQADVTRLGHRVARVGGDEFAILVAPSPGVGACTAVADAVLATVRAPVQVAGHRIRVSASIGIRERTVHGATTAELMKAADLALYRAKAEGKDRWTLFDRGRDAHLASN